MKTDKIYIPALTGIRAVAAYLVFFHHFNPFPAGSWGWRLANEGHIGVTIFFVLSGFLIPLRYLDQVNFSRHWLRRYFQNRFARIYPLYALLTLVAFLAIWRNPTFDVAGQWPPLSNEGKALTVFFNFTFLRGFFEQLKYTGVPQGWTLTVEECFYAFAPLLLLILTRKPLRYAIVVLGLATLGLLTTGFGLVKLLPHPLGLFDSKYFMVCHTFFGRAFEFMLGAALAVFIRRYHSARPGAWATSLGALWIVSCLFVLSLITTSQLASWGNPRGIALNNLCLPVGIGLFFYGLMTENTWLCKALQTSVAQILGKSSYAFYLVHMGVLSALLNRYVTANCGVIFIVALLLALALWKWVEEPVNHVLRGKRSDMTAKA